MLRGKAGAVLTTHSHALPGDAPFVNLPRPAGESPAFARILLLSSKSHRIPRLSERRLGEPTPLVNDLRTRKEPLDEQRPTTLADVLGGGQVMDRGIRPITLAQRMERVAGSAFTGRCRPGDNLMRHAAIDRAEPGTIIVVESGEPRYALAGGNVCAVAERRGFAALVLDGMVCDLAEVRTVGLPVLARGVIPCAAAKEAVTPFSVPVQCDGVTVHPGDIVVADEEGIVVVAHASQDEVRRTVQDQMVKKATQSRDGWEQAHHAWVEEILRDHDFQGVSR